MFGDPITSAEHSRKVREITWGGGDEAVVLGCRTLDGVSWVWATAIWDLEGEVIVETAYDTTTTPVEREIAERWPGAVRCVEVLGLNVEEAAAFLAPLVGDYYEAGQAISINNHWVEWDGHHLVPTPGSQH